jgi:hypothetical protein
MSGRSFLQEGKPMAFERQELECENEINAARKAVAQATNEYRKGGSPNKVNAANQRLAEAHETWREVTGGNVPDRRYGSR